MKHPDNAVLHLARAITSISSIAWPFHLGESATSLIDTLADLRGSSPDLGAILEECRRTEALVERALTETLGPRPGW